MTARLGEVIYWGCSGIAVIIIAAYAYSYYAYPEANGLALTALFGVPAALIWLIGRACLYVLAGR
jgi:hypothetical protein